MNSILSNSSEMELSVHCNTIERTTSEDIYATSPLVAVRSIYRQSNEEELHSSFEEAIFMLVMVGFDLMGLLVLLKSS